MDIVMFRAGPGGPPPAGGIIFNGFDHAGAAGAVKKTHPTPLFYASLNMKGMILWLRHPK
ncbi:MAG: hypothetical protein LBS62_00700 [Clostridiales bacterium]|nr:hypothetical protein [Clostridiales bacterium]